MAVIPAVDPVTGEPAATAIDPETGEPVSVRQRQLDEAHVDGRRGPRAQPESAPDVYILKIDLQQAEEVAHAQNQGAQFTIVLRPPGDKREVDRSSYGETTTRC